MTGCKSQLVPATLGFMCSPHDGPKRQPHFADGDLWDRMGSVSFESSRVRLNQAGGLQVERFFLFLMFFVLFLLCFYIMRLGD